MLLTSAQQETLGVQGPCHVMNAHTRNARDARDVRIHFTLRTQRLRSVGACVEVEVPKLINSSYVRIKLHSLAVTVTVMSALRWSAQ